MTLTIAWQIFGCFLLGFLTVIAVEWLFDWDLRSNQEMLLSYALMIAYLVLFFGEW